MGAERRNLQARPKILKKLLKRQINYNQNGNKQKSMFGILKEKRILKFVRSYPTEFAGSTQNPKNIIGTSN
jgi:hypothetical protein